MTIGGIGITDGLFQRTIKDVSGDGTLFFTEKQLWYEFNQRLWRRIFVGGQWGALAVASTFGGIVGTVASSIVWPFVIGMAGAAFGVTMLVRARARGPGPRYDRLAFGLFLMNYLRKWIEVHGPIEKLLPSASPEAEAAASPAAADLPPDVTAYSFDRALVTDSAAVAALLVANRFHFENSCAILSRDGYPHNRVTILEMLHRNPRLTVFALHDASVPGCSLPRDLRQDPWFPEPAVRIFDLGLRPQHVQKMPMILTHGGKTSVPPELARELSDEEVTWLAEGSVAELEAIRPARLMRAIYQGFARANEAGAGGPDSGAGGIIWIDGGYGGPGHVYAADSFG